MVTIKLGKQLNSFIKTTEMFYEKQKERFMKSHDKFHEKQLKSSMEKGLQKKADMLYCLLCGYSPYSEVGNSDRLLICGVYLQAYGKDLPEHL